ncbi:MAG: hypothetical protein ACLFUH_07120 [Bacteroidales bacterium]
MPERPRDGKDVILFALKKVLEDAEGFQYHITPSIWGRILANEHINNGNYDITVLELKRYRKQLAYMLKWWQFEKDRYDLEEWDVRESNGHKFKLVFERYINE